MVLGATRGTRAFTAAAVLEFVTAYPAVSFVTLPNPVLAFIALGANLGDREANLRAALAKLAATPGVHVERVSKLLDNPAIGGPSGSPPFLNAVAAVETALPPHALLGRLLEIEKQMGRVRSERNAPRPIDLDLILYADEVIDTPELTVPHPRMHERRFVMQPLAEIAPDLVHPTLGRRIDGLLLAMP